MLPAVFFSHYRELSIGEEISASSWKNTTERFLKAVKCSQKQARIRQVNIPIDQDENRENIVSSE